MKRALILAAGKGKRLGRLTQNTPKCLLPINSEKVLIDFSLEALYRCNIKEIFFITGFLDKKLKEYCNKNWSDKFMLYYIFNEKYSDYNNIYSAYLARDIWDDETVLLNSDIIFDPEIFYNFPYKKNDRGILQYTSTSFLVIDDSKMLTNESMKVKIDNEGKIKKINKNLNIKNSFGEYIGILYLCGKERVKFLKSLETNIKSGNFDLYYEDALDQILNSVNVCPFSTNGLNWTEVDTEEDYKLAKQVATELEKDYSKT